MAISTYRVFLMLGDASDAYVVTEDTSVVVGKTYYTRTGTSPSYVYTPVQNPSGNPHNLGYYEKVINVDYEKLIDIKDFPDLGGSPEMLETTTLSDNMQTYIPGIQSLDALEFTANYTLDDFETLKDLEDTEQYFAVWFGGTGDGSTLEPTGEDGKFIFKGKLSAYPVGGGVNEVVNMTITIAPSTPIELDTSE